MPTATRLGGTATPLPGAGPFGRVSRRTAMVGALAAAGFMAPQVAVSTTSTRNPAMGLSPGLAPRGTALGANDARLVALADAYAALDREVNATLSTAPGFDSLVDRFEAIEVGLAETPADGLPGIVAKARALQVCSLRHAGLEAVPLSLADDVWRLFGGAVA